MSQYQFKPKLLMTLATLVVMSVCIWAGVWQYNKGQAKIAAQQQIDQGLASAPVGLPAIDNKEGWEYKRVQFKGIYMPEYQMLLDNRVHNGKPGYQVVTPVKVDGEADYVLVNRGWITADAKRTLPTVETPAGEQTFVGDLFFPIKNVFTLESKQALDAAWQPLWQHIDMARYQAMVPFEAKPYMVRLAKDSDAAGFVREWPVPKSRVKVHLGYAYQWFGFAFTFFVIYIVLNFKKLKKEDKDNE